MVNTTDKFSVILNQNKKGRSYWLKVVVLTNKMWVASDRRILQKFW